MPAPRSAAALPAALKLYPVRGQPGEEQRLGEPLQELLAAWGMKQAAAFRQQAAEAGPEYLTPAASAVRLLPCPCQLETLAGVKMNPRLLR